MIESNPELKRNDGFLRRLSERAFQKEWDNSDDAEYDSI